MKLSHLTPPLTIGLILASLILLRLLSLAYQALFFPPPTQTPEIALTQTASLLPVDPSLLPPYIRLTPSSRTSPDQPAIDIRANTATLPTQAADITIQYDSAVLSLKTEDSKLKHEYAVIQINTLQPGRIDVSLFSQPQRNEPTLTTPKDQETTLATLYFTRVNPAASTTTLNLLFTPNQTDETNLIRAVDTRPETPTDVLQSVKGLTLSF